MKVTRELKDYQDILQMPHYESRHRTKMSIADRAAQFSPFAAVVGYDKAVEEAGRHTDSRKELDEMEKAVIDDQLRELEARLPEFTEVEITYFKSDDLKDGGQYVTKMGKIKKLDGYQREVVMVDGTKIGIDEIYSISS